jgi:hypothetical protein
MRPLEVSEVQPQTEIYLDARAAELQGSEPLLQVERRLPPLSPDPED